MGYRSEVAIRCQDKAFEMFEKAWGELIPDKVFHNENDHLIYWDWVKWYKDYPEVSAITLYSSLIFSYASICDFNPIYS